MGDAIFDGLAGFLLDNKVQHYAWGSADAIPALLGVPNPESRPFAELWMGAHPAAPSRVRARSGSLALDALIARDPAYCLGPGKASLPYLLKVLSAAAPLSIQAHPSREEARAGFDREERSGPPLDSPDRLYKDRNHKPEIIAALGPYEAMCGFRPAAQAAAAMAPLAGAHQALDDIVSLSQKAASGAEAEFRAFFAALFRVRASDRRAFVAAAAARSKALSENGFGPDAKAYGTLCLLSAHYPEDPGVLSALYLNLISLEALDALYIPHGLLHAYLRGTGIELMANSDNVLRGGLTPKKIDPAELASILSFAPFSPPVLRPAETGSAGWSSYPDRCPDFSLAISRADAEREGAKPEIILCAEGSFTATAPAAPPIDLPKGRSAFIPALSGPYAIKGRGLLFRASIPD